MRLPELRARPQQAERPSQATVRPTDLGLGAVAQDVGVWEAEVRQTRELEEEVQYAEDERAVQPLVDELTAGFEERFADAGEQWDGVSPGFARGVNTMFDAAAAGFADRDGLTPGQQGALQRRISQYREATGQRAIQYQVQRRGQIAAQQAQARRDLDVQKTVGGFVEAFAARRREIDLAYDGSQPDYTAQIIGTFDAQMAETMAAVPVGQQAAVQQRLTALRTQTQGSAIDAETRGEQTFLAAGADEVTTSLINGVMSAPATYETAVAQLDQIGAVLPAGVRRQWRTQALSQMTEGYIDGLVSSGQHGLAGDLLSSGSLDARLSPSGKAAALRRIQAAEAERTREDYLEAGRLQQDIEDDLASVASTGQGVPGVSAARIEQVMGPAAAAEYMLDRERAIAVNDGLSNIRTMTPGQMSERLDELRPEAGEAGYAEKQRIYALTEKAMQEEREARERDPAAWAIGGSEQLQQWLQGASSADPAVRSRAAAAYAAGVLHRQEQAGIPASERRILPKSIAAATLQAARDNPNQTMGLMGLGQWINQFGARPGSSAAEGEAGATRRMKIIGELSAAGGSPSDLAAAVTFQGNSAGLGAYIAARGSGRMAAMKPADQTRLKSTVDTELATYLSSFAVGARPQALLDGQRAMVAQLAAGAMGDGMGMADAVDQAAKFVTDAYRFEGRHDLRVPRAVAAREGGRWLGVGAISRNLARETERLTAGGGGLLRTPNPPGSTLSADQRRRAYADSIRTAGRWVTTADDRYAMLVTPTAERGWAPVQTNDGAVVVRSWDEVLADGRPRQQAQTARPAESGGQQRRAANSGAPRGLRNNNPLNLEYRRDINWQGQTGSDGRFATFGTMDDGLRAGAINMITQVRNGHETAAQLIRRWAPPHENDTGAYVRRVTDRLGIHPNQRLNFADTGLFARLLGEMVRHENGQQPIPMQTLTRVAQRAWSERGR